MEDGQIDETEKVIEALQNVIKRDEAHFENKMTLVSSGAIALLLAFLASLKTVYCPYLFIWGISLLGLALSFNLGMYIFDKFLFRRLMYDLAEGLGENPPEYRNAAPRNNKLIKWIDRLNAINLFILLAGLVIAVLFVYKNVF